MNPWADIECEIGYTVNRDKCTIYVNSFYVLPHCSQIRAHHYPQYQIDFAIERIWNDSY